jgi:hypothetical protein
VTLSFYFYFSRGMREEGKEEGEEKEREGDGKRMKNIV